ncbi:MAG: hypothetical protein IE926_10555 [Micrococcales bacterium]|nr:hypothetical protein [Micrococcales bacterium]
MTPAARWRRAALGVVVGADVLVLLVAGVALPGLLPFLVPLLVVATAWALHRPAGWGALTLLVLQVVGVGVAREAPVSLTDWALAAVTGAAVVGTHLALSMLAAYPPGAALPDAAVRRWVTQGFVVATVGGIAAGIGVVGSSTPAGAGPWVLAAAFLLVAGTAALVWRATRTR